MRILIPTNAITVVKINDPECRRPVKEGKTVSLCNYCVQSLVALECPTEPLVRHGVSYSGCTKQLLLTLIVGISPNLWSYCRIRNADNYYDNETKGKRFPIQNSLLVC